MSSFYQLMMRKKEQIMYATIKGSLTENDGVFSGFSETNYLALQHIIDFSKPFEILLKFTPTDFTNPLYLFSTRYNTNSGFDIYIQNSKIRIWGSTNGTSLDISSYSIDTININTTYWYKLKYSPTQIIAELSTDGINFVQENNIALSNQIYQNNYNALIGHGQTVNANYFVGSIDLPNSYIKLGSTKYNLQAVVGYTVVGSLTESPSGVFSGFVMNSDYLKLAQQIETWDTNLEAKIDIITPSVAPANAEIICANGNMQQGIKLTTSLVVSYQLYDVGGTYKYCNTPTLEPNTRYTIIFKYNKQTKKMSLRVIGTNIDNTIEETLSSSPRDNINATYNTIFFGAANSIYVYAFTGSIDIANSYIKINNKLWFNGQQA